ncbi:MAG: pyridoxamine 5'-phosphate oxidase family protein [Patescibacteria group bacterium]|nr:pyridoxamine 5'-phosphate oxidase family protein [Patescibacteria group bacterium]
MIMEWEDNFKEGKELILATCSKKCIPNANIVISLGFVDDKLLVANCQMKTTIKNLKENQNICVVGGYVRLKGTVEIFSSGKYFDLCVKKNKDYTVKNAILITVNEVFDLDKVQKIL